MNTHAHTAAQAHTKFYVPPSPLLTHCESLMELEDVNVIHGQARALQDLCRTVRWPERIKQKET